MAKGTLCKGHGAVDCKMRQAPDPEAQGGHVKGFGFQARVI